MNDEQSLVDANMHLVRLAVDRFASELPNGIDMKEVHSSCVSALRGAAKKYDPKSGGGFEQYASGRIRGAMLDAALRYVRTQPGTKKQAEEVLPQDNEKLPNSWFTPNPQIYDRMLASPELPQLLASELAQLPEADRIIIHRLYRENKSIEEIAVDIGLTEARVSRIRDRVLRKIFTSRQSWPLI